MPAWMRFVPSEAARALGPRLLRRRSAHRGFWAGHGAHLCGIRRDLPRRAYLSYAAMALQQSSSSGRLEAVLDSLLGRMFAVSHSPGQCVPVPPGLDSIRQLDRHAPDAARLVQAPAGRGQRRQGGRAAGPGRREHVGGRTPRRWRHRHRWPQNWCAPSIAAFVLVRFMDLQTEPVRHPLFCFAANCRVTCAHHRHVDRLQLKRRADTLCADPEVRRVLDARSHGTATHGPAPQSNQPAVTLPMFITDALSYEARTTRHALVELGS